MERYTIATIRDEWQIKLHACLFELESIVAVVQQHIKPGQLPRLAQAYITDARLLQQQIKKLADEISQADDPLHQKPENLIRERFTYNRKIRAIEKNVFVVRYQLLQAVEKLLPLT